jgi:hypothetical protein
MYHLWHFRRLGSASQVINVASVAHRLSYDDSVCSDGQSSPTAVDGIQVCLESSPVRAACDPLGACRRRARRISVHLGKFSGTETSPLVKSQCDSSIGAPLLLALLSGAHGQLRRLDNLGCGIGVVVPLFSQEERMQRQSHGSVLGSGSRSVAFSIRESG